MIVLVRPSAACLRHLLAAFSMAGLPELRRKRLAHDFVAIKHRGSWFCTDNRSQVFERFFNAASDHVDMVIDPLGGARASDTDSASEIAAAVRVGFGLVDPDPSSSSRYEHNPN